MKPSVTSLLRDLHNETRPLMFSAFSCEVYKDERVRCYTQKADNGVGE